MTCTVKKFGLIVEGHGEVDSLPTLCRRIGSAFIDHSRIRVSRPFRISRDKIVKPGELERAVEFLRYRVGEDGLIILLLDADDDCPLKLSRELRSRISPDIRLSVVIANREFESWFLAGITSLRGKHGIKKDASFTNDPEAVRDAKSEISKLMIDGRCYGPTRDQSALAKELDIVEAIRARSFRKLKEEIEKYCMSNAT